MDYSHGTIILWIKLKEPLMDPSERPPNPQFALKRFKGGLKKGYYKVGRRYQMTKVSIIIHIWDGEGERNRGHTNIVSLYAVGTTKGEEEDNNKKTPNGRRVSYCRILGETEAVATALFLVTYPSSKYYASSIPYAITYTVRERNVTLHSLKNGKYICG